MFSLASVSPVSEMTYTVSSGTLNPSIPYHRLSLCLFCLLTDYSNTTDQIFLKFYGMIGHNSGTNPLGPE